MPIKPSLLLEELAKATKEKESIAHRFLQCEQKMRGFEKLKSDFIAIVSHQLRTPLSNVRWHLEGAMSEKHDGLNATQKNFLEQALKSAHRMADILDNLMKIAEIEKGGVILHQQFTDFGKLVQDALKEHEMEIKRKKITVSVSGPKKVFVNVDAKKIEHVMHIFIDNAIRYNMVGGKIFLQFEVKGKAKKILNFSIRDTGIGIPKDQLPRLFTKFFRTKDVVKLDPEGSGLSLFIAKSYVEAHDGKITVESEGRGKGSTFSFTLSSRE